MRPFRQSSTGFEHARVSTNTGQFIEYEAVRVCTQSERTFLAANVSKQIMAPNGSVLRSLG